MKPFQYKLVEETICDKHGPVYMCQAQFLTGHDYDELRGALTTFASRNSPATARLLCITSANQIRRKLVNNHMPKVTFHANGLMSSYVQDRHEGMRKFSAIGRTFEEVRKAKYEIGREMVEEHVNSPNYQSPFSLNYGSRFPAQQREVKPEEAAKEPNTPWWKFW